MKKLQKRKAWAIMFANGRLSLTLWDRKRALERLRGCGSGEKIVKVEIRELRK